MRKHLTYILSVFLFIGAVAAILPGCDKRGETDYQPTIIMHPSNLEIPGLIAEGVADIMITDDAQGSG